MNSEDNFFKWEEEMKKEIVIQMTTELEARPIAMLVQTANEYASKLYLELEGKRINAKSIMGMMSLGMMNGTKLILDAEGEDEAEAIAALEAILTNK